MAATTNTGHVKKGFTLKSLKGLANNFACTVTDVGHVGALNYKHPAHMHLAQSHGCVCHLHCKTQGSQAMDHAKIQSLQKTSTNAAKPVQSQPYCRKDCLSSLPCADIPQSRALTQHLAEER